MFRSAPSRARAARLRAWLPALAILCALPAPARAATDATIHGVIGTQAGFVQGAFGNIHARGNHANVQYQVDGVPIPDSVGNLFAQALPVRLVQGLELITGGMPAEYGERLAAVVNLQTRH